MHATKDCICVLTQAVVLVQAVYNDVVQAAKSASPSQLSAADLDILLDMVREDGHLKAGSRELLLQGLTSGYLQASQARQSVHFSMCKSGAGSSCHCVHAKVILQLARHASLCSAKLSLGHAGPCPAKL